MYRRRKDDRRVPVFRREISPVALSVLPVFLRPIADIGIVRDTGTSRQPSNT